MLAGRLPIVALTVDRLDVVAVSEALGRQVCRLDVVDVLGGNREAGVGAGTAQRFIAEDASAPSLLPVARGHPADRFGVDRRFAGAHSLHWDHAQGNFAYMSKSQRRGIRG